MNTVAHAPSLQQRASTFITVAAFTILSSLITIAFFIALQAA